MLPHALYRNNLNILYDVILIIISKLKNTFLKYVLKCTFLKFLIIKLHFCLILFLITQMFPLNADSVDTLSRWGCGSWEASCFAFEAPASRYLTSLRAYVQTIGTQFRCLASYGQFGSFFVRETDTKYVMVWKT